MYLRDRRDIPLFVLFSLAVSFRSFRSFRPLRSFRSFRLRPSAVLPLALPRARVFRPRFSSIFHLKSRQALQRGRERRHGYIFEQTYYSPHSATPGAPAASPQRPLSRTSPSPAAAAASARSPATRRLAPSRTRAHFYVFSPSRIAVLCSLLALLPAAPFSMPASGSLKEPLCPSHSAKWVARRAKTLDFLCFARAPLLGSARATGPRQDPRGCRISIPFAFFPRGLFFLLLPLLSPSRSLRLASLRCCAAMP